MTRHARTDASAATSLPAGQRIRLLAVLAGSSGAAPLATDMYVPGLPELATSLGADASAAQLSLTGFLAGIIAGQLILGPLSDAVGRRPVLLCGTIFFVVFSVICAAAPTMTILDAARFGQGVSGAAGIVLARAVVADLFADRDLAGMYARLGAITAAAPILAPLAGGALLLVFPWRAVFVVLAALGAVLAVGVWRWIPESRPPQARSAGGVTAGLRAMAELLARRDILGPVLAISFGGAAVFAYIAGTTFVFQGVHRLTPAVASLVYGVNAVGNMAGSLGYGRLVKHWSAATLLVAGAVLALAGSAVLFAVSVTVGSSLAVTWFCLFFSLTAFGVFFPAVVTLAQQRGRAAPGATSALLGGGQFLLGAAASPLVGLFGTRGAAPLAAVMAVALAAATVAAAATRDQRVIRAQGEP
ncbi:multidrug effflux MFS transporter [Nocardia brasiliensis]